MNTKGNSSFGYLLLVSLLSFVPSVAFGAGFVTVGSRPASEGGVNVTSGLNFAIQAEQNRSYACTAFGNGTGSDLDLRQDVTTPSSGTITARYAGNMTPVVTEEGTAGDNRIVFTPTESGTHLVVVEKTAGAGENASLECLETTIYGGYNTNVSNFNFLELLNISNGTVTAVITAVNFDGTTVINAQSVTVEPNRRADIDLHTAAGANKFGMVMVSHDGPFGSLQGRVSMYSGTASDFSLDASVDLRSRDQNL